MSCAYKSVVILKSIFKGGFQKIRGNIVFHEISKRGFSYLVTVVETRCSLLRQLRCLPVFNLHCLIELCFTHSSLLETPFF